MQDEGLMPACHQRVRLAVRLDEVTRSSSKAAAEKAWRRHHAEEMGIELSGSDADVDVPDQEEGPEPSASHPVVKAVLWRWKHGGGVFVRGGVGWGGGGYLGTDGYNYLLIDRRVILNWVLIQCIEYYV